MRALDTRSTNEGKHEELGLSPSLSFSPNILTTLSLSIPPLSSRVLPPPQGLARSAGGASPGNPLLKKAEKLLARYVRHRVQGQVRSGAGTRRQLLALPEHGGGWGSQSTMRSAPVDQTRWLALAACGTALWRLACWQRWVVSTAENVAWNARAIRGLLENFPLLASKVSRASQCLHLEATGPPR